MRDRLFSAFSSALIFFALFTGCSDKTPSSQKDNTIFGSWETNIGPVENVIPDKIVISMDINEDSTYSLIIAPDTGLSYLTHKGNCTIDSDSIFLNGNSDSCFIIDTTASPDTLVSLPDSVAEQTISIPVKYNDNGDWQIPGSSFEPVVTYFPVAPQFQSLLSSITIVMIKQ